MCIRISFIDIRGDNPSKYLPRNKGTTYFERIVRIGFIVFPTISLYIFKTVLGIKYDVGYDYYIPLGTSFGVCLIFGFFSLIKGLLNKFDRYRSWEYFFRWSILTGLHLLFALGTVIGLLFSKYQSLLIPITSCFELFIAGIIGIAIWVLKNHTIM